MRWLPLLFSTFPSNSNFPSSHSPDRWAACGALTARHNFLDRVVITCVIHLQTWSCWPQLSVINSHDKPVSTFSFPPSLDMLYTRVCKSILGYESMLEYARIWKDMQGYTREMRGLYHPYPANIFSVSVEIFNCSLFFLDNFYVVEIVSKASCWLLSSFSKSGRSEKNHKYWNIFNIYLETENIS